MIRKTLPIELQDYYSDLYNIPWDISKVEILEEKNFWLFKRILYRIPDAWPDGEKVEPIYVYYYSIGKKRPTVSCTDILGGVMKWNDEKKRAYTNYPIAVINSLACVLFKRWNAFIVCSDNKGMFNKGDTIEHFKSSLLNIVYNNIQAVQFIKTLPTTDTEKIYSIGVSLGALTMAGVYGIEDSYKKAVIILGGWPLDKIIANSSEGMVKNFYNRMITLYGNEVTLQLKDNLQVSNDVYAFGPGNGVLQIMIDNKDTSVPSEFQQLYAALIRPKELVILKYRKIFAISQLKNAHYQTLLYYPYLIYRSLKFFNLKSKSLYE